jgi:chromosome segregation ATPase
MTTITDNDPEGSTFIGVVGLALLMLGVFPFSSKKGKEKKSALYKKGEDQEKLSMSNRILELESENTDLRDRLRKLEMEYLERQEHIKTGETGLKKREKDLEDGLKEVYALKLMIDEYRLKVGTLNKEKGDLETQVGELTASLKEGNKRFEVEREGEIKKLEDEIEEVKIKAKEMVVSYKKETEGKLKSLDEENKTLKDQIAKMKEQYSAWESIEGL